MQIIVSTFLRNLGYFNTLDADMAFATVNHMERLENKIKRLRIERDMSQEDVAKELGVSRVAVTKWESGQTENLKLANLIGLCRLFKIGVEEFLCDAFPEIKCLPLTTNIDKTKIAQPEIGAVTIYVYSIKKITGGEQLGLYQGTVVSNISFSEQWISENLKGITSINNVGAITGIGDSMSPTYEDGDILIIDTGVKEVKHDGVYIFSIDDAFFVKRIRIRIDGKLEISSDNPTVKTSYIYDVGELPSIHGEVMYVWNGRKLV